MPLPPALRALVREIPTVSPLPNRAFISVTGSQAGEFLNGLTAGHVPTIPSRAHFYTAFLHAQGRVIHDVFIWSQDTDKGTPGYIVEYDARPSEAPPLLPMLKRHVLRSKVKLRDVTEEYDAWAAFGHRERQLWDTEPRWDFAQSGIIERVWNGSQEPPWGREKGLIRDRRGVGMGERLLVRKGDRPHRASDHDVKLSEEYVIHRILKGVPEGSDDIPPLQAFPMDSNIDVMGGVDFRKGCYVGQELTVRTYHKGQLRKRILPVVLHRPGIPLATLTNPPVDVPDFPLGSEIRPQNVQSDEGISRPRPRGTGKLLSSTRGVGLALLRLEQAEAVEQGKAKFTVADSEGHEWEATPFWPDWWPSPPPPQGVE